MAFGSSELGDGSSGCSANLPSSNSGLPIVETIAILRNWGIHTLGQLAALNKGELRTRLGAEAVRLWERANGTATRLLKLVQPPETFDETFEFDHEIETAEPLLFILRRFLEHLALRLSSIYLVARELMLTITFSNSRQDETTASPARTHIRVFKIPQPTNDVDLLFRMLHTHLENFKSEHPIVAVGLSAKPIRPVSQQFGLFETALRNPHQLYETLARLTALVGNDRVGTPVLEETDRPDAFRMEGFNWDLGGTTSVSSHYSSDSPSQTGLVAGVPPATTDNRAIGVNRPHLNAPALRRFRPPANAAIFISDECYLTAEAGDWRYRQSGSDSSLPGDKIHGQIIDQIGPFLLSGNWWDEKAWARAEYDMQLENGKLVRAHECPPSSDYGATSSTVGTWKLDGIYD